MSGLLGMARAAGRARGRYMATEQEYNRARQAQQDAMNQERFMRERERFHNEMADRETRNQQNAERFKWAQQNQQNALADRETRNARADTMFGWAQQNQKNAQEDYNRKVAAYKLGQKRDNQIWEEQRRALFNLPPEQRQAAILALKNGKLSTNIGFKTQQDIKAQKQAADMTMQQKQRKEIVENINPGYMASILKEEYDLTDDEFKAKGLTREKLAEMLANQYKVDLARGINVDAADYVYNFGKKYGLRSNYDMAPVSATRSLDKNFVGRRNLTDEDYLNPKSYDGWVQTAPGYAAYKANPSRYMMQNQMYNQRKKELSEPEWTALHNNIDASRRYSRARAAGKSKDEAYKYAIGGR